jgi:hypothetical protein
MKIGERGSQKKGMICIYKTLCKTVTSSFIETNSLIFLFESVEAGVKFYMLWNLRCLKHYYGEVKNSGRLEDKDFSAMAHW